MIIHGAMPSYFKMKDRGQMCANVVIIIMTKLFGGAQIGHYFMEDFPLLFCYINIARGVFAPNLRLFILSTSSKL